MIVKGQKSQPLEGVLTLGVIFLILSVPSTQAISQSIGNGALVSGLTAGAALRDPFAAVNPSGAGSVPGAAVSIWTTRPYNISDIRIFGLSGGMSIRGLGIAPRFRAFGFDEYYEYQTSINFGLPITRGMDRSARMGLGIQALSRTTARGGFQTFYVVRTGLLIPVASNIDLGAILSRSVESKAFKVRAALVGLAFRLHEKTTFYLDVFSEALFRPSYRLGVSTRPVRAITLRMGASTNPDKLSAGLSIQAGTITGSIAVEYHLLLGATTTIETTISQPGP